MNLAGEFWITHFQLPQPVPASYFNIKEIEEEERTNFNPNSIRVSLRYSPGSKRARSPLVRFTAPGAP
jgi:hypothetical protein